MSDSLGELHPSRLVARRMHELETELQRARMHLRRHSKSPETLGRWNLDQPAAPQQEEGWFITYLDMMTLLLVVMIVMLAFSGTLGSGTGKSVADPAARAVSATVASADTTPTPTATPAADETAGAPATPEPSSPADATGGSDTATVATGPATVTTGPATTGPATTGPASTGAMVAADAGPAEASVLQDTGAGKLHGDGLLPAGSGLLPGHASASDTLAIAETYPGWSPAGTGALPPDATVHAGRGAMPTPGLSTDQLYPGWSAADLAASFIGPPRPGTGALAPAGQPEQHANGAADTGPEAAPVAAVADASGEDDPSEGETLAAGLSLGNLGSDVEVVVNERSVSFRVNSEILFDSSQADLSRSGLSVLRRIVGVLGETGHEITVEGHTDSVAVRRNVRYPSNWELSSARAGSVVRYLQANGIASTRLKAIGYADTRPIGDNHTPEGRARNRRVELLIEKRD